MRYLVNIYGPCRDKHLARAVREPRITYQFIHEADALDEIHEFMRTHPAWNNLTYKVIPNFKRHHLCNPLTREDCTQCEHNDGYCEHHE